MQRSLILLFFLVSSSVHSQLNTKIIVDGIIREKKTFNDTLAASNYVSQFQYKQISSGYFFASVDSVISEDDELLIYLHEGKKYNSQLLIEKNQRGSPFRIIAKTIDEYSSNGFPFVQVRLDSVSFNNEVLVGKLNLEQGPEIRYDSAFLFNPIKTNKKYIYQLLDIIPGTLFSESNYQTIDKKVERSPFLKLGRPVDISFRKKNAVIFLDLLEETTSSFQGILGLQQGQENKPEVVGSLDLSIGNLFSSGKELNFFWEKYGENSQKLNLFYKHPFFLDSKISPTFSFDLLKQDSVFLSRSAGIGLNTFVSPKAEISLQFQKTTGTLLSNNQKEIVKSGAADFEKNNYQIELKNGFMSSLGSLKKGIYWRANIGAGRKEVKRNLNLQDSFYDTIRLETNFFQCEVNFAYQLKVWKRQTIFQNLSGGYVKNSELLTNELYRQGGLNSIRGFNEKFFFADRYISSKLEFRSFFEDKSYLYLFYDQLLYGRNDLKEYPLGIGIGFALATSSGQFSFVLAAGKSGSQEIDFSEIKAHFGYISRF